MSRPPPAPISPFPSLSLPLSMPGILLPGQQQQAQGAQSVITSASNHALPTHLEITRQLDGSYEEELTKLERAANSFWDELDQTMTGAGDPRRREEAFKALQAQLSQLSSLSRSGLGALPIPPSSDAPSSANELQSDLKSMTDKWAGEVPALYARRQGWKEGVSVVEGVFKRVG